MLRIAGSMSRNRDLIASGKVSVVLYIFDGIAQRDMAVIFF